MPNLFTVATFCLFVSVIAQGGSCHASQTGSRNANSEMRTTIKNHKLPAGVWGGQHVRAEVNEAGAAFEFDCARGSIAQAIVLDGNGKFDLGGNLRPSTPARSCGTKRAMIGLCAIQEA